MATRREPTTGMISGAPCTAAADRRAECEGRDFVRSDVDQKKVGDVRGRGALHLSDNRMLHDVHRGHLHDAEAQRGKQRGRWISGAIKIGQAVAQS